jgi:cyclohexanecarboxylate-CoA ligase
LGVRPGNVVACQLPNWWQAQVLVLAATRLGAVVAPIMTTIRPRELERMLRRLGASVGVTVDEWAGFAEHVALGHVRDGRTAGVTSEDVIFTAGRGGVDDVRGGCGPVGA